MKTEDIVVLVNDKDEVLGLKEKIQAHREGLLHRAFSVFVFDSQSRLLLQRRSRKKYHSGGLWANTCCSHPREGETYLEGAHRRLREEMGMTCNLVHAFYFIYEASLDNGLREHELDHVFIGYSDKDPIINTNEVDSFKWIDLRELKVNIAQKPEQYAIWFRIIFEKYRRYIDRQTDSR